MSVTYKKSGYTINVVKQSASKSMAESHLAVVMNAVANGMAANMTTNYTVKGAESGTSRMAKKIRSDLEEVDGTWHVTVLSHHDTGTAVSAERDMFGRFVVTAKPLNARPAHEAKNNPEVKVIVYSTD